ncbi:serine/threonine-protein kinase [Actinoplanes rectilineatus]|uniref:serine/threonine-protein kinase n=1 Tax=Actinoplanes rectilineatus TaxID=113571 RepID=UPI000698E0EE|nr:serine/threonine-protein kinase [Actinoplanes rectilineatus]
MPTEPLRSSDPTELGGYRLLGRLGEGGMGAVYLGQGPDGPVAVKAIRADMASHPEFRGRFRSEVNRARQVPSFCTAAVLDADPESAIPYLVVEFVDGPDLAEVVAGRGPLSGGELYSVAIGVATALTAIHGAGVIHRDLKPRNVLFSLGTPKVIDFGIARAFESTSNHTRTDQMVGTLAYMAPERFEADARGVGPAADVFAWGVVVAYAATGRTPFQSDSPAATAARILTQPPDLGGLTSPLREIVSRSLDKDPARRPTAAALLELLLDTGSHSVGNLAGSPELRRAAQAARRGGIRRRRRGRRVAVAAAGVAVLALLGAIGGLRLAALDGDTATLPGTSAAPSAAALPPSSPIGEGLLISDPLERDGQWHESNENGICEFADGRLVARSGNEEFPAEFVSCDGPDDKITGDHAIAVTVALRTPTSCAVIWFWGSDGVTESGEFAVDLCAAKAEVWDQQEDSRTTLAEAPTEVLADKAGHRVQITVEDKAVTVSVDDAPLLDGKLPARSRQSGQVWLSMGQEPYSETTEGNVTFQDVEIREL